MKHNTNNRRSRSRGNKQRHGGGRNNYESNGPGGKVRGTVQQVLDKYLGLARDAQSSGDRIGAESFFQYAEHYFRVLNVEGSNGQARRDKASSTPVESSEAIAEGSGQEASTESIQDTVKEISDTNELAVIEPGGQPQSDLENMIPPNGGISPDTERGESTGSDLLQSQQKELESSSEEVETSTAS